jgi:seryl-tRNA synthetase
MKPAISPERTCAMLDIKWIRDNPGALAAALVKRSVAPEEARATEARVVELDEKRRAQIVRVEEAQARRNAASKDIGKAKAAKDEATAAALMAEVAEIKTFLGSAEDEGKRLDKELEDLLAGIPNVPFDDVPVGADEHGNVEKSTWGTRPTFNAAKEHYELGEALGMMDFETAAKLSGSRFVVLKKGLARMERALGQFMLDLHTTEHGYEEVQPPILVKDDAMFGTAQLPKFRSDQFGTSRLSDRSDVIDKLVAEFRVLDPKVDENHAREVFSYLANGKLSFRDPVFDDHTWTSLIAFAWDNTQDYWRELREGRVDLWLIPLPKSR